MQLRPEWEGDPGEVQAYGPGFLARTHLVRRILRELRPDTLLDIGCGRGNVTRLAAPYARYTLAIEITLDAARLARQTLSGFPQVEVLAADVFGLNGTSSPLRTGSFDILMLSEVLEHLDDDLRALAVCRQLVRPGGWLLLTVPAHPRLWTDMDDLIGHRRRYRRAELIAKLEGAGFTVETLWNWGFPITGWFVQRGQRMRARRLRSSPDGSAALGLAARLLPPASAFFRVAAHLERPFASLDRGVGYVALARTA